MRWRTWRCRSLLEAMADLGELELIADTVADLEEEPADVVLRHQLLCLLNAA